MSIYQFCEGCKDKHYEYDDSGKLISHSCPSHYNPFDEDMVYDEEKKELVKISKCPRHERFMQMERQKQFGYNDKHK